MTRIDQSIKLGKVRKVQINTLRAKSLVTSSEEAIQNAKEIIAIEGKQKTILRELYEGLRQFCEAIGYTKGYQFLDHESITFFLEEVVKEPSLATKFDKYRKLRNGINYYGNELALETVKEALTEIPRIVFQLKKYLKE